VFARNKKYIDNKVFWGTAGERSSPLRVFINPPPNNNLTDQLPIAVCGLHGLNIPERWLPHGGKQQFTLHKTYSPSFYHDIVKM